MSTVSPIDITSVRASGVPQVSGMLKAYVVTYFTNTTPSN
jgi:hypothetical protein